MIEYLKPHSAIRPILISVPHAGTEIPPDLRSGFIEQRLTDLCDTDWHVPRLYEFARELGIGMVHTRLSRWVIDMNRDPDGKPLYNDGRAITELVPTQSFSKLPLYRDGCKPDVAEIMRRRRIFFEPYHGLIRQKLAELKTQFNQVMLLDAHSIVHAVPAIRPEPFPDLILGSNDGRSSSGRLIDVAAETLSAASNYSFKQNDPFKGGFITRHFGEPAAGIHALQLEMVQKNYMDEQSRTYDPEKASEIQRILSRLLSRLLKELTS
jgi:N-formylglutamate amidohydrolase